MLDLVKAWRVRFAVSLCVLGILCSNGEGAVRVQEVHAVVSAEHALPPLVQKRMEHSVQLIAEQLLLGKSTDSIALEQRKKEQLIHEVFDKVLVGYSVTKVTLLPSADTEVRVQLQPWNEVIQTVTVNTKVEGMSPRIESLVQSDLQGVETVFADTLTGLPVAASDWTNGVLKHALNAYLAEHLPEFRGDFELLPEKNAQITLVVYPRLPVVRTVDLSMRSDTVPNMLLLGHRELMQEKASDLAGVPVSFVQRHQAELSAGLAEELDQLSDFRQYRMKTKISMQVAERLHLMSRSDTDRYRLRLTGWLDIGRKEKEKHDEAKDLLLRVHAGKMLSHRDEGFFLFDVMPQDMDWSWAVGLEHALGLKLYGQARYDLRTNRFVLAGRKQLAARWWLRYEYRFADHLGESGIRYKLHDFLSLEYLMDKEQGWLRLLGNF